MPKVYILAYLITTVILNVKSSTFYNQYLNSIKENLDNFIDFYLGEKQFSEEITQEKMMEICVDIFSYGNINALFDELVRIINKVCDDFVEEKYEKLSVKSYKGNNIKELFSVKELMLLFDDAMEKLYEKRKESILNTV